MNHTSDSKGGRTVSLNDLNDDVLVVLCSILYEAARRYKLKGTGHPKHSLLSLSLTSKRFRVLCVPYLFRSFKLAFADYNATWEEAAAKLQTWDDAWSRFVSEINIHMVLGRKADDRDAFADTFLDTLASTLLEISTSSPYLEKISLQIEEGRARRFEDAFKEHGLQFSTVRSFHLWANSDNMITLCPDVTTLSIVYANSRTRGWLVTALAGLPRLKHLSLSGIPYTVDIINSIFSVKPNLVTLCLPTYLSSVRGNQFVEFAQSVSQFSKLEILCIPAASSLSLGCTVPPCTRGATDHAAVRRRHDEYMRKKKEVEQHAASTFFNRCPHLKELYVGTRMKATMDSGSDGKLQWRQIPEFTLY